MGNGCHRGEEESGKWVVAEEAQKGKYGEQKRDKKKRVLSRFPFIARLENFMPGTSRDLHVLCTCGFVFVDVKI